MCDWLGANGTAGGALSVNKDGRALGSRGWATAMFDVFVVDYETVE